VRQSLPSESRAASRRALRKNSSHKIYQARGTTVVCITGNGLKTTDASPPISGHRAIAPRLDAFEAYLDAQLGHYGCGARA